jgi:hypothetical protein
VVFGPTGKWFIKRNREENFMKSPSLLKMPEDFGSRRNQRKELIYWKRFIEVASEVGV